MECKEAIILKESHELREQNELLEFRIIELEEGADKVSNNLSTKYVSIYFNFIRCNLNVRLSSRQVNLLVQFMNSTAVIAFCLAKTNLPQKLVGAPLIPYF